MKVARFRHKCALNDSVSTSLALPAASAAKSASGPPLACSVQVRCTAPTSKTHEPHAEFGMPPHDGGRMHSCAGDTIHPPNPAKSVSAPRTALAHVSNNARASGCARVPSSVWVAAATHGTMYPTVNATCPTRQTSPPWARTTAPTVLSCLRLAASRIQTANALSDRW